MVILGLGSNMGDRLAFLSKAVSALVPVLSGVNCSPVYESQALLAHGAPDSWNIPFLNLVIMGECNLDPLALLTQIKTIENTLGRVHRGDWAPREIDIDILSMDDTILNIPELSIPHQQMLSRDFVLLPLADVAPNWRYPGDGIYKGMSAVDIVKQKKFLLGEAIQKTQWVIA